MRRSPRPPAAEMMNEQHDMKERMEVKERMEEQRVVEDCEVK